MNWCLKAILLSLLILPTMVLGQEILPGVSAGADAVANPATSNSNAGTGTSLINQLNQGVIDSQANNEKYYQDALANPSNPAGSVIQPSADGAMIATPGGPKEGTQLNLTDAEKRLSDEFVHDGMALRKQEELCAKLDDPSACRGNEPDSKFMGMDSNMVMALSKAYTMIVGAMGGAGGGIAMKKDGPPMKDGKVQHVDPNAKGVKETTVKNADGSKTVTHTDSDGVSTSQDFDKNNKPGEKTTEGKDQKDRQDYCKYIAVGTEAVAMFQSQMTAKNASIPASQDTAQKEILYKAARTHQDRAKTHKTQFVGWGATTACYGAMFATGAAFSVGNVLKLAGAGLLTKFFKEQADLNEGYYKKVKGIADQLPGKGDCNPITEKDCYCAQQETMNDPAVCLPQLHSNQVALGNYRVACIDANGKADPKCTCIDAQACLDRKIMNELKPFGIGTAFNSAALRPISNLSNGQLTGSDLASAGSGSLAAYNKRALDSVNSKAPNPGALNANQQKAVKALVDGGLAPKLAAIVAKQPVTGAARAATSRFRGGRFGRGGVGYKGVSRTKRGSVLNFSGGRGGKGKRRAKKSANPFARFGKKKAKASRSGKVLNYQNKALQSAQINKNKDRPIFENISRRYQVSGFKRLEVNR